MASESAEEMQSILERLINSRNRDLSMFIPFLLGFTSTDPTQNPTQETESGSSPDDNSRNQQNPDEENQGERIVLINPLTQGMVVIEGTTTTTTVEGFDSLFRGKEGQPPASKSAIESLPSVEIREEEEDDCVICLEECRIGEIVKEMPCEHKFHGGCIEKWLGIHGTCPVCRFKMPVDEEGKKKDEERENNNTGQRQIWVSFVFGRGRRRTNGDNSQNLDSNFI